MLEATSEENDSFRGVVKRLKEDDNEELEVVQIASLPGESMYYNPIIEDDDHTEDTLECSDFDDNP